MAKSKSPSAGKTSRTGRNKEENSVNVTPSVSELEAATPITAATEPAPTEIRRPEITAKPEVKPEPKKLEVVKSEPRKNVVPINLDDEIRRRAYELFQQRGGRGGNEAEDWYAAEREVRQRYHRESVSA
jgi:hypothetical protein